MKKLILVGILGAVAALAACDEPTSRTEVSIESDATAMDATPAAEDVATPAAESAVDAAPTTPEDTTVLPPEDRTSEETVKPESETLFY